MLAGSVSPFDPRSFISQPKNATVSKSSPGAPGDAILYLWCMLLHARAHIHAWSQHMCRCTCYNQNCLLFAQK